MDQKKPKVKKFSGLKEDFHALASCIGSKVAAVGDSNTVGPDVTFTVRGLPDKKEC